MKIDVVKNILEDAKECGCLVTITLASSIQYIEVLERTN